ncbi:hypothetical protein CBL_20005 [Carabus blaptoides fortunei]
MNEKPHIGMKLRKRIALAELQVLVSLLVKFWRNNHGDSISDIWKPTWWPSNIRFTYPIQRNRNISPAMWRKDLVAIITSYYYTTRNSREHLNGRDVLNNGDFLCEFRGQLFPNNNDNATVVKPNRSTRENSIQLSENTLKRLMPRVEVRLVDILATDEYRKFREHSEQKSVSGERRQKEFLRNFGLITLPEYDNMDLDARYTFRASTKTQSNGQPSLRKLQIQEADEKTNSILAKQNEDQLTEESNQRETRNKEQQNNEKQITVEGEILTLDIEPIVVDTTEPIVVKTTDTTKICLQKNPVESICEDKQSFRKSTVLMKKVDCEQSSSIASIDLDELSLKARVSLQQCSPSYVKLNKHKASNERRKKKLKEWRIKQRVLQPRTARMICRLKINSSYVRNWKNGVKYLS